MTAARDEGGFSRRAFLKSVAAGAVGLGLTGAAAKRVFAEEDEEVPEGMRYRTLGRTGMLVSVVAFGGVPLRPEHGPILLKAHEMGVNLFDVAWGYGGGQAEVAIGNMLETKKVKRDKIFVMTKASGFRPPSGKDAVYDALRKGVEASLERMKTDYVDVFMWPHGASSAGFLENDDMKKAMMKLRDEKLIRHFGVSTHSNYAAVSEAVIEDEFFDVIMPVVNVCTQKTEKAEKSDQTGSRRQRVPEDTTKMLAMAAEKNVGIVAMKAANGAFLMPNTADLLKPEFPEDAKLSYHQKLYRYILAQEGVNTGVIGITNVPHLQEMIEVGTTA